MPYVASLEVVDPPHRVDQQDAMQLARRMFQQGNADSGRYDRLFDVFQTGQIKTRYFAAPLSWFMSRHSFEEKNELFVRCATELGVAAVRKCLDKFPPGPNMYDHIDAVIFISSTGIATPGVEVKIMNELGIHVHAKRIPLWGLGCAGGVAGLARAAEYCLAHPQANVLVICVELCSLTFQPDDHSKSNVVGASLFADGVACALVCGDEAAVLKIRPTTETTGVQTKLLAHETTLLPDSEQVMGWDIRNEGFFVVFSRHIPGMIADWVYPTMDDFLQRNGVSWGDIGAFVAHPGGRKILEAYEQCLPLPARLTQTSRNVLQHHGNMSSATVFYALKDTLEQHPPEPNTIGLMSALGPGFSSEIMLLSWV